MSSFSNILKSIKNPGTPPTATPKPAIKKVKIANNRSDIKDMSDVVEAASKRTTPAVQHPGPQSTPKPTLKKRKADSADISTTKPTAKKSKTKTPVVEEQNEPGLFPKERDVISPKRKKTVDQVEHSNTVPSGADGTSDAIPKRSLAENLSLERMKEDALKTLEERRYVAQDALDGLMPFIKKSKAIETAVAVLEQQIEDCDLSIKKLRMFGRDFETGKIKGTDSQTLLALASGGLDVKITFEDVSSSQPLEAAEPVGEEEVQTEAEVEDTRFSDETLAEIFGPVEETEEDVKYDIFEPAPSPNPIPASIQRPVTSTASSNTNSRPALSRFVDPTKANKLHLIDSSEAVDAMNKTTAAEKKQSPKKKGGVAKNNSGSTRSKVYRNKDRELRFRK